MTKHHNVGLKKLYVRNKPVTKSQHKFCLDMCELWNYRDTQIWWL